MGLKLRAVAGAGASRAESSAKMRMAAETTFVNFESADGGNPFDSLVANASSNGGSSLIFDDGTELGSPYIDCSSPASAPTVFYEFPDRTDGEYPEFNVSSGGRSGIDGSGDFITTCDYVTSLAVAREPGAVAVSARMTGEWFALAYVLDTLP